MAYRESKRKLLKEGDDFYNEDHELDTDDENSAYYTGSYYDDPYDGYDDDYYYDDDDYYDDEPTLVEELRALGYEVDDECTEVTIPDGVTEIGWCTFANCTSLTSITIPNSVTKIRGDAFHRCENLKDINIPNKVKLIGDYAFEGCKSLTSVTIPDSVTEMGIGVFSDCENLKTLSIPFHLDYNYVEGLPEDCQVIRRDYSDDVMTESKNKMFKRIYKMCN